VVFDPVSVMVTPSPRVSGAASASTWPETPGPASEAPTHLPSLQTVVPRFGGGPPGIGIMSLVMVPVWKYAGGP